MSKRDRDFVTARWLWFAGAGGAMLTYLFATGLVSFDFGDEEDEEEEDGLEGRQGDMEEMVFVVDEEGS